MVDVSTLVVALVGLAGGGWAFINTRGLNKSTSAKLDADAYLVKVQATNAQMEMSMRFMAEERTFLRQKVEDMEKTYGMKIAVLESQVRNLQTENENLRKRLGEK